MSEKTGAIIKDAMKQLPESVRQAIAGTKWEDITRNIAAEEGLDETDATRFENEAVLALIGITDMREIEENLVRKMGLTPGLARQLIQRFDEEALSVVMEDAERRGHTFGASRSLGEETYLKEGNVLVTNSRFIRGSQSIAIDSIVSVQYVKVPQPITTPIIMIVLGGLGALSIIGGNLGCGLLGILLLAGGIAFMKWDRSRHFLMLNTSAGEEEMSHSDGAFLQRIDRAINRALASRS